MLIKNFRIILVTIVVTFSLCGMVWAEAANNPLITAPEISAIVVDGNLSEWEQASEWANFGRWWNGGLDSVSQAQYAWNGTNDMLYIGVESTESLDLSLSVGGLMGNLSDPYATPLASNNASQIQFDYNDVTGVIDITNSDVNEVTTGVSAAHTWDGTTMTIEISIPIYSNWRDDSSAMALSDNTDVYIYADVFNSGITAADSQVASGLYANHFGGITMDVASKVTLYSAPTECGDLGTQYLDSDLDSDCYVTFDDFAMLAADWMDCTDPNNLGCQ